MNRELTYNLLKYAMFPESVDCKVFAGVTALDWERAYQTVAMHGLASFVYDAVSMMPEDIRPPKEIILRFISANMATQGSYAKLKNLSVKIDGLMKDHDIRCLLLKGLSLAEYYPRPQSRKFLDIDLYAPQMETKVDEAFKSKGVKVDTDFYRHSHMTVGGILVENHMCLLDVRGRDNLKELDADLKRMALERLQEADGPGIYYPDAQFSLIFNLHHAMSHFIYEGISFKFLVDWILFITKERELLNSTRTAESLHKHSLMKFAAVLSEVSVRHLGLPTEYLPECIRQEMSILKPKVVDRFIADLFRPYEKIHQENIIAERLNSVRRIIKASWKPKEFLGQSAVGFVWDKFLPILQGKKFEAD